MTKESSGTIAGDDDVKERAAEERGIRRHRVLPRRRRRPSSRAALQHQRLWRVLPRRRRRPSSHVAVEVPIEQQT